MPAPLNPVADEMELIACRSVILRAAQLLEALPFSDEQAAGFRVIGADEVLCRADEVTYATADERHSFNRWRCCHALFGTASAPDDLTLLDCIRWLTADSSDDEDCVTYEQVIAVALGPAAAQPPVP